MEDYDPLNAPDPDEWQSMDEDERITLVMEHHREAGVELPNEQSHAVFHVVVEIKIALGDEVPTQATMDRLIREGLDRHDATYAVGSVFVIFMHELLDDGRTLRPAQSQRNGVQETCTRGDIRQYYRRMDSSVDRR